MTDLNQCTFTGRLGRDPEIRSLSNGGKVANLNLAVDASYKAKSGEKVSKTHWVPIVIWSEGLVGVCERFLSKGSRIAVVGEFQTRKYQDKEGNDRYSTEIVLQGFNSSLVMLDSGKGNNASQGGSGGGTGPDRGGSSGGYGAGQFDEEIPFAPFNGI